MKKKIKQRNKKILFTFFVNGPELSSAYENQRLTKHTEKKKKKKIGVNSKKEKLAMIGVFTKIVK